MSATELPRPQIVCNPVLNFTQADANHIVSLCPYKPVENKKNLILVLSSLDKDGIEKRQGSLFTVHMTQEEDGTGQKIEGEWESKVPIGQTSNKHIFQVEIKYT